MVSKKYLKDNDEPYFIGKTKSYKYVKKYVLQVNTPGVGTLSEDNSVTVYDDNSPLRRAVFVSIIQGESSVAHKTGIHENDIILAFNNWRYNPRISEEQNLDLLKQELNKFEKTANDITVFRVSDKVAPVKSFKIAAQNPGFEYEVKYLTHNEYSAIKKIDSLYSKYFGN